MFRTWCQFVLLCAVWGGLQGNTQAKTPNSPEQLRSIVREVCRSQIQMLQRKDSRLRYQVHRYDRKGETTRDQIESHDGGVARLVLHNGKPLTFEENEGERTRLQALLGSHKLADRERDEIKNRAYGVELLQVFPDAMRFVTAAQQAPVPDVSDRQIVVDFAPDPSFRPSGMAQQILMQLYGRLWIDLTDHQLLRMELHNAGDVNLAWGLLAKVYAGGQVTYDQRKFQDLYTFTHIAMHLKIRELMLKTVSFDTDTTASNFKRMTSSPSGDEAIRMLLAITVPTQ